MKFKFYLKEFFDSFSFFDPNQKSLDSVIDELVNCKGKVIVSGLGKTGLIGRKFSATLSSIGIPSCFLHTSEALHGDLGIIQDGDLLILISQSGNSPEIVNLLKALTVFNNRFVGITSNVNSFLFENCHLTINLGIKQESTLHSHAPSISTSVLLVILDYIALKAAKILEKNDLDFAKNHPGGSLGRRLAGSLKNSLMDFSDAVVSLDLPMVEIVSKMSETGFGCVIFKQDGKYGLFTDGDLRRLLKLTGDFPKFLLQENINWSPVCVESLDRDLVISKFENTGVKYVLYLENEEVYLLNNFL